MTNTSNLYLSHHGILGQKWGIRRFQNKDGSLTKAGKARYQNDDGSLTKEGKRKFYDNSDKIDHDKYIKYLKSSADAERSKSVKRLSNALDTDDLKLYNEALNKLGYKNKQDKINAILKAVKNNAYYFDDDAVVFQDLDDELSAYSKGLIDKATFDKHLDKASANLVVDSPSYTLWSDTPNEAAKELDSLINVKKPSGVKNRFSLYLEDYNNPELSQKERESARAKEEKEFNKAEWSVIKGNKYNYLIHHGIKGQKWGIRRYQNTDGSLTDEGYRHYGYGKHGKLPGMTENTRQRINQGAKLGAKIGAGLGAASAALDVSLGNSVYLAALGVPIPVSLAVGLGATTMATYAASGALHGALYGGIVGAIETKKGQKYIENQKADNIKISDLKEKE